MIQLKSWFFQITKTALKPGTRFKTTDQPTEATYQNLIDSSIFKSESGDRAKEDTGTFSSSTSGHVTLATNEQSKSKVTQKPDRSLVVQPSQLPEVVESSDLNLTEGTSEYTGKMLTVVDDPAVTSKSFYKITVVQAFQDFLNSVFDKVASTSSGLTALTNDYNTTKSQVSQNTTAINSLTGGTFTGLIPVGSQVSFGGSAAPSGWVLLKGDVELDKTTYADLYAVVGDVHGTPSLGSNFIVWKSDYDERAIAAANATNFATAGADNESLSLNHLPNHKHEKGSLGTSSSGNHHHNEGGYSGFGDPSLVTGTANSTTGLGSGFKFKTSDEGSHTHSITGDTGNIDGYGSQQALSKVQSTLYINQIMYHGVTV